MGNFFTKNKSQVYNNNNIQEPIRREPTPDDIKDIIKKYEHIKNSKRITDIDKLINVMNNTDWTKTKTNTNYSVEPSAPPLPLRLQVDSHIPIPIAVAHIIEVIK